MKAVPEVVCCLPLVGVCVREAADDGVVGDPVKPLVVELFTEFQLNLLRNVLFGMGGGVAKSDCCCCCSCCSDVLLPKRVAVVVGTVVLSFVVVVVAVILKVFT